MEVINDVNLFVWC